jgi:hypothetical protein
MKRTFVALATLVLLANTSAFANKSNIEILSSASIQPSVKYVGSDENGSAYQVKVDAPTVVPFEVTIKDKAGMILFTKVFEAASFSKTFKVLEDDDNSKELTFSITSLPDGKANNFKVSTEEKAITEISVVKGK